MLLALAPVYSAPALWIVKLSCRRCLQPAAPPNVSRYQEQDRIHVPATALLLFWPKGNND